jgi:hypothetical protein
MKNLLFLIAGITGTIAYMLARQRRGVPAAAPVVDELAHKLQDAWADHHTVAWSASAAQIHSQEDAMPARELWLVSLVLKRDECERIVWISWHSGDSKGNMQLVLALIQAVLSGGPTGRLEVWLNQKVKNLIQKLGEAIHESVSESEDIAGVVRNIREQGFDVMLMLEATIGLNEVEEETFTQPLLTAGNPVEGPFTSNDVTFLKSLRISLPEGMEAE